MDFNLNTCMWSYQKADWSVGTEKCPTGPWDFITGGEVINALDYLLQNSQDIEPPSGIFDQYAKFVTENSYFNSAQKQNASPRFVTDSNSNLIISMDDKAAWTNTFREDVIRGPVGAFYQENTANNFFFAAMASGVDSYLGVQMVPTSFTPRCSGVGSWTNPPSVPYGFVLNPPAPSGFSIQSQNRLRYTIDKTNTRVIQSINGEVVSSSAIYDFDENNTIKRADCPFGWAINIQTSLYNAIPNLAYSDVPLSIVAKAVVKNREIEKCSCNNGYDEVEGYACLQCFGLGWKGMTSQPKRYDISPNATLYMDSADGYFNTSINKIGGIHPNDGYLNLQFDNGKEVYVKLSSTHVTSANAYAPKYFQDRESLEYTYNAVKNRFDSLKPGCVNISFADAVGGDDLDFSDISKFNWDTQESLSAFPYSSATPVQAKHYEKMLNAFTRGYAAYWDGSYNGGIGRASVYDCIGSVKSGSGIVWAYSVKESGCPWVIKGHPYDSFTTLNYLENNPPPQFQPLFFYSIQSGFGDESSISQLADIPSITRAVLSSGSIYSSVSASGQLGSLVSTLSGSNSNIERICNTRVVNGLYCPIIKSGGVLEFIRNPGAGIHFSSVLTHDGLQDLVAVPKTDVNWFANKSTYETIGNNLYSVEKYEPDPLWVAKIDGVLNLSRMKVDFVTFNSLGETSVEGSRAITYGSVYLGESNNKLHIKKQLHSITGTGELSFGFSSSVSDELKKNIVAGVAVKDSAVFVVTSYGMTKWSLTDNSITTKPWSSLANKPTAAGSCFFVGDNLYLFSSSQYRLVTEGLEFIDASVVSKPIAYTPTITSIKNYKQNQYLINNSIFVESSVATGGTNLGANTRLVVSENASDPIRISTGLYKYQPLCRLVDNPSQSTITLDDSIIQLSGVELEVGAELPNTGNVDFLISRPCSFKNTLPFFGRCIAYADNQYVYNRSFPDLNLVGKVKHRSGAGIKDIIQSNGNRPGVTNASSSFRIDTAGTLRSAFSSACFENPRLANTFGEIGEGDKTPSFRGFTAWSYHLNPRYPIFTDMSYSPAVGLVPSSTKTNSYTVALSSLWFAPASSTEIDVPLTVASFNPPSPYYIGHWLLGKTLTGYGQNSLLPTSVQRYNVEDFFVYPSGKASNALICAPLKTTDPVFSCYDRTDYYKFGNTYPYFDPVTAAFNRQENSDAVLSKFFYSNTYSNSEQLSLTKRNFNISDSWLIAPTIGAGTNGSPCARYTKIGNKLYLNSCFDYGGTEADFGDSMFAWTMSGGNFSAKDWISGQAVAELSFSVPESVLCATFGDFLFQPCIWTTHWGKGFSEEGQAGAGGDIYDNSYSRYRISSNNSVSSFLISDNVVFTNQEKGRLGYSTGLGFENDRSASICVEDRSMARCRIGDNSFVAADLAHENVLESVFFNGNYYKWTNTYRRFLNNFTSSDFKQQIWQEFNDGSPGASGTAVSLTPYALGNEKFLYIGSSATTFNSAKDPADGLSWSSGFGVDSFAPVSPSGTGFVDTYVCEYDAITNSHAVSKIGTLDIYNTSVFEGITSLDGDMFSDRRTSPSDTEASYLASFGDGDWSIPCVRYVNSSGTSYGPSSVIPGIYYDGSFVPMSPSSDPNTSSNVVGGIDVFGLAYGRNINNDFASVVSGYIEFSEPLMWKRGYHTYAVAVSAPGSGAIVHVFDNQGNEIHKNTVYRFGDNESTGLLTHGQTDTTIGSQAFNDSVAGFGYSFFNNAFDFADTKLGCHFVGSPDGGDCYWSPGTLFASGSSPLNGMYSNYGVVTESGNLGRPPHFGPWNFPQWHGRSFVL
jgi:hypothetical protein